MARHGRARNGMGPNTKMNITRSFLELQSPVLAWKFMWTVRTKYKSTKSTKEVHKYKSTHNSVIFWATDSRFCMEVRMDSPNKLQKYKSTKSTKKVQKST